MREKEREREIKRDKNKKKERGKKEEKKREREREQKKKRKKERERERERKREKEREKKDSLAKYFIVSNNCTPSYTIWHCFMLQRNIKLTNAGLIKFSYKGIKNKYSFYFYSLKLFLLRPSRQKPF